MWEGKGGFRKLSTYRHSERIFQKNNEYKKKRLWAKRNNYKKESIEAMGTSYALIFIEACL